MKETAEDRPSTDETKPDANPGLLENKIRHHPDGMDHQRNLKGPKKKTEDRGSRRLTDCSSGERFPRCQQAIVYRKKLNSGPNDRSKHVSPYRDTHMIRQPAQTHTLHHDDPGLTTRSVVDVSVDNGSKYRSAGVPARDLWLCLPDEVWLSILSLLPHRDLCRVVQVCCRLHALASDHSLWKNLRIENSTLTDQCLLCVGRHCPRSVCLYSCSGFSVSFYGLQMFFFLCRNSLKELKVTSCTGPGLHGDQMLSAISQLCDHVTSVDVSWSGATDTGAKSLRDCGKGLKSVVLNGCRVSDPPLKELVVRHKDRICFSLCRLEVFGCQFLTPSWLQTVYEVTDTIVHTLLQNSVELQSLCFSCCPGVTDLTLHSISKYSPCIRSLDVSGCKAVTDAGVQSLALGCRRLQQLDLSSTRTGNRGVSLLANYCNGHHQTEFLPHHLRENTEALPTLQEAEGAPSLWLRTSPH